MHQLRFLNREQIENIQHHYQTPVYVYSEKELLGAADNFLSFPSAFGHTVRYAMKANSNKNILKIFHKKWIKIDAWSDFEAYRALAVWFQWPDIQISGQETPKNIHDIFEKGIFFVATSLKQIETVWKAMTSSPTPLLKGEGRKGLEIWVRINPGMGSWAFKAIATGWETSAFGIWHEYIPQIKELSKKYNIKITKIHIHIGSENTPESWMNSAKIGLDFVSQFDTATILDMWGGFKKAIMPYEHDADLQAIGKKVAEEFQVFYEKTGRKIHLEVEPGKYMVINSGAVIAQVDDRVNTGANGYTFLRLNTGMTEMPRVPMYGVQQPIIVLNDSKEIQEYVVVGHCCESGDILTSKLYDSETIEPITLPKVNIWDTIVVEGTGAYNASMSMKNYNSYPEAGELLLRENGEIVEIRKRQTLEDIWRNEVEVI